MKLRIKGNSLRIRVGRMEFVDFLHHGRLQDTIRFASAPDAKLSYALEFSAANTSETQVRYLNQEVTVVLTTNQVLQWSMEQEIGVYTKVPLETGSVLDIVVEKDFACIDRREEDDVDTFENPSAGPTCQVT